MLKNDVGSIADDPKSMSKEELDKALEKVPKRPVMLIADDVEMNRVLLSQFFQDKYDILEASDGREAIALIEENDVNILIVDLVMPVMDGYEVLKVLRRRSIDIPVIVMTARNDGESEARAMEMGAADFITKPYNPTVVQCRVRNVMARVENEWQKLEQVAKDQQIVEMHATIERDALTGLYNREAFYQRTADMIRDHSDIKFCIIYLDISCFKAINDLFRVETGNLILRTSAYYFLATIDLETSLAARIEADHFVICLPESQLNIERLIEGLDNTILSLGISHNILFYAGVYPVEETALPVDQMCDRAHMALNKIKGNYMNRYAYYDASMRDQMLQEQMIVRDMNFALQEHQFTIFLQPVYSLVSNHIVSAEALVRWFHPVNGMISPGKFIPVFERNGFIVKLDRFVWEEVCKFLKRQRESGQKLIPVSVNVSRMNFYNLDLLEFLLNLIERYELEPWMLKLEITESAYTDNPHQLTSVIKVFREEGFPVLMDDFGSGYSSLNMLKNLPVDVLKIDMAFVRELEKSARARSILKSIMHLAFDLDMGVVVEGVETKAQVDFLASIGADDIQGYYFSKPLPVPDFIERLKQDWDDSPENLESKAE